MLAINVSNSANLQFEYDNFLALYTTVIFPTGKRLRARACRVCVRDFVLLLANANLATKSKNRELNMCWGQ